MLANLKRTVVAFCLVVGLFLAYRVTAVPLLEPEAEEAEPVKPPWPSPPPIVSNERFKRYAPFFPPDAWEMKDPIVLESDRSMILMKTYQNLDNGQVRLDPCTVIFVPDGATDDDPASHRVIVLQAPQGALLQFDQAVDLQRGKLGKLLGGRFDGPITIRGTPSRPGADDDLAADTKNVKMDTEKIWTPEAVRFRFGKHTGSGREMVIHLAQAAGGASRSLSIGGLESFELLHDVQMHLVPGAGGMMPLDPQRRSPQPKAPVAPATANVAPLGNYAAGAATSPGRTTVLRPNLPSPIPDVPAAGQPNQPFDARGMQPVPQVPVMPASAKKPAVPDPPVDVRCDGPFQFDLTRNIATFVEQVKVVRVFPDGLTDRMDCDWLAVHFTPKAKSTKDDPAATDKLASETENSPEHAPPADGSATPSDKSATTQKMPSLEPSRIEARGKPVILRAPSNQAYIRAGRLDYDLVTGEATVEDPQEATVQQAMNEIHCRLVVYQPGEPGHLGRLLADGPGWLRGVPPAGQEPGGRKQEAVGGGLWPVPSVPQSSTATPPPLFEAHWSQSLKMRPFEGRHVISLLGDARAALTGQGELAADEIHLWLIEPPEAKPDPRTGAAPPHSQAQPDRLLAAGHVRINSPQLIGNSERLETWFVQATANSLPAAPANGRPAVQLPAGPAIGGPVALPPTAPARRADPGAPGLATATGPRPVNAPASRYKVEGQRIRVQFAVSGSTTEVENLAVDQQVHLVEIQTATPGDQPLVVAGDQLEVLRANAADTQVTVSGKPGQAGTRGLEMYGAVIRMDKAANRLWINGPGRMKLPANRVAADGSPAGPGQGMPMFRQAGYGDPAAPAGMLLAGMPTATIPPPVDDPMWVNWQDHMDFDGLTAHIVGSVIGESHTRHLRTPALDVTLRQRIDFAQPHPQDRSDVARILCHGDVLLENRTYELDKQTALEKMFAHNVMVDEVTGLIEGEGPGWVTSVRRGDDNVMTVPGAQPGRNPAAAPRSVGSNAAPNSPARQPTGIAAHPASSHAAHHGRGGGGHQESLMDREHLNYLNAVFQGPLTGNVNQHEITLHDQVRSIYGPVLSWDDQLSLENLDELDEGDIVMNCDQLTVRQAGLGMPAPRPVAGQPGQPPHQPMELETVGNTLVEARQFTARANRMTYTEAKDLLILEGDGRVDAQLFRQDRPGAPQSETAARKIYFWRTENRVTVNDARFFNLDQPPDATQPGPAGKKPPVKPGTPGVASPPNTNPLNR